MTSRPFDSSGDILPVLSPSDMISGPAAAAAALRDHLCLYRGEWWEYAERGNEILDLISISRCTEQDAAALVSCLTSYILTLPGIVSVSDASASFSGHTFTLICKAHTEEGDTAEVHISF